MIQPHEIKQSITRYAGVLRVAIMALPLLVGNGCTMADLCALNGIDSYGQHHFGSESGEKSLTTMPGDQFRTYVGNHRNQNHTAVAEDNGVLHLIDSCQDCGSWGKEDGWQFEVDQEAQTGDQAAVTITREGVGEVISLLVTIQED